MQLAYSGLIWHPALVNVRQVSLCICFLFVLLVFPAIANFIAIHTSEYLGNEMSLSKPIVTKSCSCYPYSSQVPGASLSFEIYV